MPATDDRTPRPTGASADTIGGTTNSPAASASGAGQPAPASYRPGPPPPETVRRLWSLLQEAEYTPDAGAAELARLLDRAGYTLEEALPPTGWAGAAEPETLLQIELRIPGPADQAGPIELVRLSGALKRLTELLSTGFRAGAGDFPPWPAETGPMVRYRYELTDRPDPWGRLSGADRAFIRSLLHRDEVRTMNDARAYRCRRLRATLTDRI